MLRILRRGLDATYALSGAIAALFMIAILLLIVAQMVARWTGNILPGAASYAGYSMAAASFFALSYTLNHGAHIRVSLMLNALGKNRRFGEIWVYSISAITATYFARYAIKGDYWSYRLHDISQGQDAWPIWIPQLSMSIGTVLLAVALWDHLVRIIFTGHKGVDEPETSDQLE